MKTTNLFALVVAISCLKFTAVAQTWTHAVTARLPITDYPANAVVMSADGCKLAATASTAHPIFSTDAGNTWHTNQSPGNSYLDIASSADGTKLFAPMNSLGLYTSTNSGSNWMPTTITTMAFGAQAVSSSALGNILVAGYFGGVNNGLLYISTNSGFTWSTNTSPNQWWLSVASSADGTKLAAAAYKDKIYVSTNFGTTWTPTKSSTDSWFSVACSADGTKLIASGNATYISTNFGGQWTRTSTNPGYVASSADGTKLVIAGTYLSWPQNQNRSIYTSTNSGVTWVSNNVPPDGWNSVASSADGSELVASGELGIWIGRTTPSPQMTVEPSASTLLLSWLVPSTNFVLQQNSDLTTTNWVTLTNVPSFVPLSLQNQVALPYSNTSQGFFRLTAQLQ